MMMLKLKVVMAPALEDAVSVNVAETDVSGFKT
jgi:hypothetical protein